MKVKVGEVGGYVGGYMECEVVWGWVREVYLWVE